MNYNKSSELLKQRIWLTPFDLNEIFAFQAFFKVWNLDVIQASENIKNSCRMVKMFPLPFF